MQVRAFLELARISNLPTVWSNCLAAWLIGGSQDIRILGIGVAGGSLVYTGGMFLNDYCDQEFDRAHRQERPIPSGRSSGRSAGWMAAAFLAIGTVCLAWIHLWAALLLAALVVTYDFWHKTNPTSPILMAACRVMLVITIAGLPAGWLALSLGLYILAISLVAKREAFGGGSIPWLGLFALALAFTLTPIALTTQPHPWMWLLPLLVLYPATYVIRRNKQIGKCVGGLLAAIPLVDLWNSSIYSQFSPKIQITFFLLSCAAILLQRVAPAT